MHLVSLHAKNVFISLRTCYKIIRTCVVRSDVRESAKQSIATPLIPPLAKGLTQTGLWRNAKTVGIHEHLDLHIST